MRVLDLFCGVGGATVGYQLAGFEVVGVDIAPQPDYPAEFVQMDAISFLHRIDVRQFDLIHASPPCQSQTALTKGTNQGRVYPNLIPETRKLVQRSGLPFILENVVGSELRPDVVLCGEMFGLKVIRHRVFELGRVMVAPPFHKKHQGRVKGWRHGVKHEGYYYAVHGKGGGKGSVAEWQDAMGIDWTDNRKSIAEAIPPAYTHYLGRIVRKQLHSE